jgi:ATP-dependent DNA ligase
MRVLQRRDLVIGGYTPGGRNFDSILVGYYEGRKLMYVAKVRAGFTPASRDEVFKRLRGLASETCPFKNLPEPRRGQWGDGLTANDHRRSMNSWPRS